MTDLLAPPQHSLIRRSILVTLAALVAYRLGTWIPLPGVDVNVLAQNAGDGLLNAARMRGSILALGVVPLLSAAILAELLLCFSRATRAWSQTPAGRAQVGTGVVLGALLLAAFQAYGIATALEAVPGLVPIPGTQFQTGIVISLVAGTALVAALATVITHAGVGGGLWVLLAAGHADALADNLLGSLVLMSQGVVSGSAVLAHVTLTFGALGLAAAVLAALVKAKPRLADPEEFIWGPLLGVSLAGWLISAAALLQQVLLPAGATDLFHLLAGHALPLIILPAVIAIVILRRRSFAPRGTSYLAAAAPVVLALAGCLALFYLIPVFSGEVLYALNPMTTVILAAVGLMVLETARHPWRNPNAS